MVSRHALLAVLLFLPQPSTAQEPQTTVQEVLEGGGYQTELPGLHPDPAGREGPGFERVDRTRPEGDASGGEPRETGSFEIRIGDGPGIVLWVLLGAVVVILLASWIANARDRHRDVEVEAVAVDEGAARPLSVSFPPVDEAERLAREGRYGAAIQLLLHHAFEALARGGIRIVPSWTSREVLRTAGLPQDVDVHLRALVEAEERSLFARRPAGPADYQSCAAEYEALLAAGRSDHE